ncbi:uncharacterized protein LOC124885856 [Capsicum annuum]|uniref:uncharacterized protein LOC124885856 n=1 Tax=Capsicum annuum TaxID=4072 RepID=UPI001FB04F01|nr:uncharacterized protein LOC124885856 [Capsicum annuum]
MEALSREMKSGNDSIKSDMDSMRGDMIRIRARVQDPRSPEEKPKEFFFKPLAESPHCGTSEEEVNPKGNIDIFPCNVEHEGSHDAKQSEETTSHNLQEQAGQAYVKWCHFELGIMDSSGTITVIISEMLGERMLSLTVEQIYESVVVQLQKNDILFSTFATSQSEQISLKTTIHFIFHFPLTLSSSRVLTDCCHWNSKLRSLLLWVVFKLNPWWILVEFLISASLFSVLGLQKTSFPDDGPSPYPSLLVIFQIYLERLLNSSCQTEDCFSCKKIQCRDGNDIHATAVVVSSSGLNIGSHFKIHHIKLLNEPEIRHIYRRQILWRTSRHHLESFICSAWRIDQ